MKDQAIFSRTAVAAISVLLSAIFTACIHESKTVTPATLVDSYLDDPPGEVDVLAEAAYPADTAVNIPTDAKIVLAFSYPIDAASISAATIQISPAPADGYTLVTNGHIVTASPNGPGFLATGTTYTVTATTGVTSTATYGSRPLLANDSWTFTTAPGAVNPAPLVLTHFPTGASVPKSTNMIEVTFSEAVSGVDNTSFTITPNVASGVPVQVAGTNTWRLPINPALLVYSTLYTVNLTTAIVDGTAQAITADTWNFTTEPDPGTAAPIMAISSHYVRNLNAGTNTAELVWVANRPVDKTVSLWGIGTSAAAAIAALAPVTIPAAGTAVVFTQAVSGLVQGNQYYYAVRCTAGGNTDTVTGQFFPAFTSTPGTAIGTPAQLSFNTLQLRPLNAGFNGTSVVAHINGANTYLSFFQADGTRLWGAGGTSVDSNTYTLPRLFRDERAGLFYTGEAGNTIFMKRVYNNAGALAFYYAGSAAGAGITVDTNSTSPAVVVVHGGQGNPNMHAGEVTKVTSGTATHNIPANPFYDFDTDFLTGPVAITNGDIAVNLSGTTGATVTKSTNFRHVLGQSLIAVTATSSYALGLQGAIAGTPFTSRSHSIRNLSPVATIDYNTGTDLIFTDHAATIPAGLGANDIVTDGTRYAQIKRIRRIDPFSAATYYQERYSLPVTIPANFHLLGNGTTWTTAPAVAANYLVRNLSTSAAARVTAVAAIDLTLDTDIFNAANELYDIHSMYCNTHVGDFNQVEPFWEISTYNTPGFVSGAAITGYEYLNLQQALPLVADTPPTNPLYDDNANFTSTTAPLPVVNNDLVINTTTFGANPNYGLVSTGTFTVRTRALNMSLAAAIADTHTYQILRFTNSHGIGAATLAGTASMRESGSSISFASGTTLTSTDADFVTQGIKVGDLVYNITTDRFATVRAVSDANNLQLSRPIITGDTQPFLIFDVQVDSPIAANSIDEPIIDGGTVTAAGNPFTDANADFVTSASVAVGDTLYNITTDTSSIITAVNATQITTSPAITMNVGDDYIIMQTRVATVYQPLGGGINAKILRLTDGSTYNTVLNLCTNTNMLRPFAASLSGGGFYTVYYNSGDGNTYGKTYNGIGTNITGGAAAADGVNLGAGETTKFESLADGSAAFMVRESGANFYFEKVNTTLTSAFDFGPIAGTQATFALDLNGAGVTTGDSFYGYISGMNIVVNKINAAGGVIYSKTIDLTALDTPFIVLTAYSLSLASDGAGGVIVSWIDNRFYDSLGVGLFSVRFDSAGNLDPNYDIDSGAAEDDSGKLMTIVGPPATVLSETDLNSALLFFNNGAAPFDSLHIWYDYRAPAGLYFDEFAN